MSPTFQGYGEATRNVIRDGFADALPTVLSDGDVHALAFDSMKLLPVLHCVKDLEYSGVLRPGATIADTSSGTWLYGMARVAAARKYHCIGVTDPAVNGDFADSIRALGAEIVTVDVAVDDPAVQTLRKQRLQEIVSETGAITLDQYGNTAAAEAYQAAAEIVSVQVPRIDVLVAPIGTGSSSRGLIRFLRKRNSGMRAVVCDTFNSALFGLPVGPRRLRGVGSSLVPRNVDHEAIDEVHFLSAEAAYEGVLRIAEKGWGGFGPTSGAAFLVAQSMGRAHPGASIVCVFPDRDWRYATMLDEYRYARDVFLEKLPEHAVPAQYLSSVMEDRMWVSYEWRRRRREDVLAAQRTPNMDTVFRAV